MRRRGRRPLLFALSFSNAAGSEHVARCHAIARSWGAILTSALIFVRQTLIVPTPSGPTFKPWSGLQIAQGRLSGLAQAQVLEKVHDQGIHRARDKPVERIGHGILRQIARKKFSEREAGLLAWGHFPWKPGIASAHGIIRPL